MPFLIRTRLSLLLSLSALAAVGCGEGDDVSPSFEDRVPLGLELKAADRALVWGETAKLTGRLTQGEDGLAGEEVVLEADPYPFEDSFAEIESATTGARGEFVFRAEPDANTEYRVAAGELAEGTSTPVRVFVRPRVKQKAEPVSDGTRFTTVFRHPEERSILGSTVFSYAAPAAVASGKLRFIRVDRVEQERQGLSSASITLPFRESEVIYATCESYTPDSGMGRPAGRCSQTQIPAP